MIYASSEGKVNKNIPQYFIEFFIIIFIILMIDQTDKGFGVFSSIFLKYFPTVAAYIVIFLYGMNGLRRGVLPRWLDNTPSVTAVAICIAMVIGGFLSMDGGIPSTNTGLSRGIHVSFFIVAMLANDARATIHLAAKLSLLYSFYVAVSLVLWWAGLRFVEMNHIFHEQVAACSIAYLYYSVFPSRVRLCNFLAKIIPIFALIITFKNTGFLIALVLLFMSIMVSMKSKSSDAYLRYLFYLLFFVLIFLSFAALLWIVNNPPEYLPSGSPEVRMITYVARLEQFMSSPLVGSFFVGDYIFEFPSKDGWKYFPSHSDLLDLLAFGGLLSLFLFYYQFLFSAKRYLLDSYSTGVGILHVCVGVQMIWLVLMAFNPILNQPALAYFYWVFSAVGLKVALGRV